MRLDKTRARAAAMFVNFSGILKKDVRDRTGALLGRIWDIAATTGDVYPKTTELIIAQQGLKHRYAHVPWSAVTQVDDDIVVTMDAADIPFAPELGQYELLLRRDILDQQIVDTFNRKVRRVNDIHLLKVEHDLIVAHVDIGLRGLLRRLGFEGIVDVLVRAVDPKASYLTNDEIISWKYVQPVAMNAGSTTMKLSVTAKQLTNMPPVDLGDVIFDLTAKQRIILFRALDVKTKAKVFENLEFDEQMAILKELDKKEIAQILSKMSSDEAADFLERLPRSLVSSLLTLIETQRQKKLSTLLGFASDSAGGLMTTEYVSFNETTAVSAALDYIRTQTKEYDVIPYLYIVDEDNHLKGVTTIRRLLFANPDDTVQSTAFLNTLSVSTTNSVQEVAYLMDRYKVPAIAVIDENRVMQGIITMDDILNQVISIAYRKRPKVAQGL